MHLERDFFTLGTFLKSISSHFETVIHSFYKNEKIFSKFFNVFPVVLFLGHFNSLADLKIRALSAHISYRRKSLVALLYILSKITETMPYVSQHWGHFRTLLVKSRQLVKVTENPSPKSTRPHFNKFYA